MLQKTINKLRLSEQPDQLGTVASSLCLVHCLATPFIFLAKSCSNSCCSSAPGWWGLIDFAFLVISFFAVYNSTKNSRISFVRIALWSNWVLLLLIILNEYIAFVQLFSAAIYIPAIALIILHQYNIRQCKCNKKCC
jgi:hypothetical protein